MSRRVLVTGGSRGIGAEICREFAALGDQVAVHCSAHRPEAERVMAALPGSGHTVVQADLRDADQVLAMVDAAANHLGGIDVLVNNAGVFFDHPIDNTDYQSWQQAWSDTLGVNLIGAANVTWCALQHMPRTGSARIVNVGSRGAFRGEPNSPAYGASKAAITAFGQSIAKSLAPLGITVTTLAPGFVDTEMAQALLESAVGDEIRQQSPFNRVATATEVARAVVALAGEWSTWASGAVLDFNGASYLRM